MKILVTAKRVPNPEQKLKLGGGQIDLSAASWQVNTFDEYAVETALRLTENASAGNARDGEVIVVSIGPKDVQTQLRSTLAMGADGVREATPFAKQDSSMLSLLAKADWVAFSAVNRT